MSSTCQSRSAPPPGLSDITGTGKEDGSLRSSERHAHLLLAQMNKMRVQSELCDVRLLVGGRVFQVHRLVLAASGPYFSALFNSAMSEAREEEVHIAGVEADVFESLLEFIYTGRCTDRYKHAHTGRCAGKCIVRHMYTHREMHRNR